MNRTMNTRGRKKSTSQQKRQFGTNATTKSPAKEYSVHTDVPGRYTIDKNSSDVLRGDVLGDKLPYSGTRQNFEKVEKSMKIDEH